MNFNVSKTIDSVKDFCSKLSYSYFLEKTGKSVLPNKYSFELTHRCNMNCPYCYVGSNPVNKDDELTTWEWLDVINQIPFYSFVTLTGGEPLLRDDFCEILEAASKKTQGKISVITNGVLIDDNVISSFIRSKLFSLSVSLDGWGENHDNLRSQKDAFKRITENLDNLALQYRAAESKLVVDIKTIVLKDNLEDILKLYQYATNNGFDYLTISFLRRNNLIQNSKLCNVFDKVFYKDDYKIEPYFDFEKFEEIYLEIQKMKRYSKTKVRFAPKFDNNDFNLELALIKKFFSEYKEKNVKEIYEPCLYPFSNTIINPMGDIYPCLSYKMGNIKEQKLIKIINNKRFCSFRKNLKHSKLFSACQMCEQLKVLDIQ